MKKVKKNVKGVTMVALVITIIVLLILSAVTIGLTVGKNGLFSRSKKAADEHIKQEAMEAMNLKITGIQIESYTENQRLPNLQYLADKLCEDKEMEYVEKETKKQASLDKIDAAGLKSIFTKIKKYPYEFEIDSELKLASIDGVKIADNSSTNTDILSRLNNIESEIEGLKTENNNLKTTNIDLKSKYEKLEKEIIVNKRIELTNTETRVELQLSDIQGDLANIQLTDSIENYKYLEIQYDWFIKSTNGYTDEATKFVSINQLKYLNNNNPTWNSESEISFRRNDGGQYQLLYGWLKNDKIFHIGFSRTTHSDVTVFRIKKIYGIK